MNYAKSKTYKLIPDVTNIVWKYIVPDRKLNSYEASYYGLEEYVANYNMGLKGACEGGHIELVDKMIELGADEYRCMYCHGQKH